MAFLLPLPFLNAYPSIDLAHTFIIIIIIYASRHFIERTEYVESSRHAIQAVLELQSPSTPLVWSQVALSVVHIPRGYIPSRQIRFLRAFRILALIFFIIAFYCTRLPLLLWDRIH